ncbi:MAG: ribosome maturation factor RimP [Oscillospiraceae bacterium]|nr:ribosome maturation factor RimP [Oscillospiraceae bacterium]
MKITERVAQFAAPLVEECGCTLWDVEFVREGGQWFLRLLIDKEGGVSINDCEAVSRKVDPVLDEEDPIEQSYTFEVWSAGIERPLKRPSDFEKFMGSPITAKLYKAVNGQKEINGTLTGYDNGDVTITAGDETVELKKGDYSLIRLRAEF